MSFVNNLRNAVGSSIAGWGGIASKYLNGGKDIRIGGGQGLGAKIAGQAKPFFTIKPTYASEPTPTVSNWDPNYSSLANSSVDYTLQPTTGGTTDTGGTTVTTGTPGTGGTPTGIDLNTADLQTLKDTYALSRSGIEAQNPILDKSYELGKNDINQGITETQNKGTAQKTENETNFGDLLRNQLQTYKDTNRQRQGVFSSLGTLDSSEFGEQQLRADQSFNEQRLKTETEKVKINKSIDDSVTSYVNKAKTILGNLALQYQSGKNAITQALASNNLEEAAALKSAIADIQNKAASIQQSIIDFANQASTLKTQGADTQKNIGLSGGSDFLSLMTNLLNQSNNYQKNLLALPSTDPTGQGYISSSNLSDEYKRLLGIK